MLLHTFGDFLCWLLIGAVRGDEWARVMPTLIGGFLLVRFAIYIADKFVEHEESQYPPPP